VDNVQTAVDSFREAAILPAYWPQALESLACALNSEGATVVLRRTSQASVAYSTNITPFVREYLSSPISDPREDRVSPSMNEAFMTDYAYFSRQEIARDPYYQEFMVPRGFGWNAAAALDEHLVISLKRGTRLGPYDGAHLSNLNAALPYLRSASRTAQLTWRCGFAGKLDAFARIGRGAILVDHCARVLETNECVRLGDGLDISGGFLRASRPGDRMRLQRFLSAVMDPGGHPSRTTTLTLPRPSGLRPWLLDGIACSDAMRSLHSRAVALLLITDFGRPSRPSLELLNQLYGLTGTESNIARELARGISVQEVSANLAITQGHVRQRLKSIFLKTGTSRQGELIALLAKLPR
jgi:DNA-binding CsgD family transcriptional regulator